MVRDSCEPVGALWLLAVQGGALGIVGCVATGWVCGNREFCTWGGALTGSERQSWFKESTCDSTWETGRIVAHEGAGVTHTGVGVVREGVVWYSTKMGMRSVLYTDGSVDDTERG